MESHNKHELHLRHIEEEIEQPNKFTKRKNGEYMLPLAVVLSAIIISVSITYSTKVLLKSNFISNSFAAPQVAGNVAPANKQAAQQAAPAQPDSGPAKVAVAGEPVLGNPNAPLTIVEFSDYECPFCKRSFTDVLPSLKSDYVNTGKVKLVYRNYPLPFHQNAHKEAQAALCAKDQGGDTAYFKFHDEIFTKTTSNGTGLALDQLPAIAKDVGLNVNQFQSCLDSGKYKDKVDKDIAYGSQVGVSGTPTWFIGKSNGNGEVDGAKIVGAQPYAVFKTAIDKQLTQ